MNASLLVKAGMLAVLGVGTATLSTSILGNNRTPQHQAKVLSRPTDDAGDKLVLTNMGPGSPRSRPTEDTGDKLVLTNMGPGSPRVQGAPANIAALFKFLELDVSPFNRNAAISAKVKIIDNRKNSRFLWSLDIRDKSNGNTEVFKRNYIEQIFQPPLGQEWIPAFEEIITLPSGVYTAKLVLYSFPAGFDIRMLNDEAVAESQTVLSGVESFLIE